MVTLVTVVPAIAGGERLLWMGSGGVLGLPWDRSSWSDSFLFFLPPAAVRQQISVLQPSHILDGASWLQEDLESIKIDFNVYQADAVAKFKKTNPGKPYVRMCVQSFDEQIPSLRALKQVTCQSGDVPVVFALVDHGEIAFYSLKEFKLPVDVNY